MIRVEQADLSLNRLSFCKISLPPHLVALILVKEHFLGMYIIFNNNFSTTIIKELSPRGINHSSCSKGMVSRVLDAWMQIEIVAREEAEDHDYHNCVEPRQHQGALAEAEEPDLIGEVCRQPETLLLSQLLKTS